LELILLPLLFGILSFFIPGRWTRPATLVFATVSLFYAAAYLLPFSHLFSSNPSIYHPIFSAYRNSIGGLTFKMGYDGIGILMLTLSNLVVFLVTLANFNREEGRTPLFAGLIFLMQFGLNGLFASDDAVMFYVFWEFTLIPIFLMLYWFGAKENHKTLLKFFIYTLLGSLFMLLAILSIHVYSHSFAYQDILKTAIPIKYACWIFSGFLFAFAVKIPLFPFHTWQPSTYASAPMAGTMLLSAIMLKMALFGMIKWMIPISFVALNHWQWPVAIIGVIGILYGAFIAMREINIRKVFAYASISHLGLIAAGIMVFTMDSILGSLIQMVNHSLIAIGLFLAAGIIEDRLETTQLNEMGGIAKLAPKFGLWFGVILLVSLSVPMTAGFIGEFLLIKSLFDFNLWLGVLSALTLVLGAVYMIRAYQMSSMGAPTLTHFKDLSWNEISVFAIIALLSLTLGLFPDFIFSIVKPSIYQIFESVSDAHKLIK
jgi:NADH-quinone oxidoreductase subunit M